MNQSCVEHMAIKVAQLKSWREGDSNGSTFVVIVLFSVDMEDTYTLWLTLLIFQIATATCALCLVVMSEHDTEESRSMCLAKHYCAEERMLLYHSNRKRTL